MEEKIIDYLHSKVLLEERHIKLIKYKGHHSHSWLSDLSPFKIPLIIHYNSIFALILVQTIILYRYYKT